MRNALKKHLSITKKEWNGLVVLIILITLILFSPTVYQWLNPYKQVNLDGFNAAAARLQLLSDKDSLKNKHPVLFRFNPNNLSASQWEKLGLNDGQVKIIKNYEAKGGRFNSKEDVKKIYSITAEDYQRLSPFINLPDGDMYPVKTNAVVEINSANAAKLMQLRGIGRGYAAQIIRYRDRLGGFCKKEQLKEVFGIDSVTYQDISPFIRINTNLIKKINLNKVTFNDLLVFPYLNYKQKNAIIEYHKQHGDYTALADLKNIPIIDDQVLNKIEPYISFK